MHFFRQGIATHLLLHSVLLLSVASELKVDTTAQLLLSDTSQVESGQDPLRSENDSVVELSPHSDSLKSISVSNASADSASDSSLSGSAGLDSTANLDSVVYAKPLNLGTACAEVVQSGLQCVRREENYLSQDYGFPGQRATLRAFSSQEVVPVEQGPFPGLEHSPYGDGGLIPFERFRTLSTGPLLERLEPVWVPQTPIDTPITQLNWSRGAFAMNLFRLRLKRMISENGYFRLDYFTTRLDSTDYEYNFIVHQPYLSGWGFLGQLYSPIDRDSSTLVLTGVMGQSQSTHFRGTVGFWLRPNQVVEFFLDRLHNRSALYTPIGAQSDSVQVVVPSRYETLTFGGRTLYRGTNWEWQAALSRSLLEDPARSQIPRGFALLDSQALADPFSPLDSGSVGALDRLTLEGTLQTGLLTHRLRGSGENYTRTEIHFRGDSAWYAGANKADHWSDQQSLEYEAIFSHTQLVLNSLLGLGRYSYADNRVHGSQRAGLRAEFSLPWQTQLRTSVGWRNTPPDEESLYNYNPLRGRFPSTKLSHQQSAALHAGTEFGPSSLRLGLGIRLERRSGSPAPYLIPFSDFCADQEKREQWGAGRAGCSGDSLVVDDSLGLAFHSYDSENRFSYLWSLSTQWWNWQLSLQANTFFDRTLRDETREVEGNNQTLPRTALKGILRWDRTLLQGRLQTGVNWQWEWWGVRRAWASRLNGTAIPVKLDEYLAMDFTAYMHVKTFVYYFKMMNFNHDRYSPEPGVHPPGVNFRFGIEWDIFG